MKSLILIALSTILITSCGPALGFDDAACAKNARGTYPRCRIYVIQPHYEYLVVDSAGNVKKLVYGSTSEAKITSIQEYVEIK